MRDSQGSPDSLDQILAEFHREMDGATDPQAVVRSFAERYPDHAAEFRGANAFEAFLEKTVDIAEDACPERLGDFRIVRRITHGGMGDIYEAIQEPLERRVVVKTIRRGFASPHARERFLREQRVLAETHETHIVPVFAAGESDGVQYFAMPYLEGTSLDFIVREAWQWQTERSDIRTPGLGKIAQRFVERSTGERNLREADTESWCVPAASTNGSGDVPQQTPARHGRADEPVFLSMDYFRSVAEVLADIADSLAHVHRHGFIHRDLKPSNIIVDTTGQGWVIDFGLAGHLKDSEASLEAVAAAVSQEGTALTRHVLGTPGYWAPEQAAGKPMDARTDVWGLGITLYELLTLRPAFPRKSPGQEASPPLNGDPPRPRDLVRSIPRDLEAICRKALGRDPDHRYETAQEFGDDLRHWLRDEPTVVRPARPPRRVALWAKRNKAWASLIVVALVAFVAVAVAMIHSAEVRTMAAQESQQAEQRKSLIVQAQGILAGERQAGWSEQVWQQVEEAAAIEVDSELRDLAVSSLLGLDAHRIHHIDYPATNVAFDAEGKRMLVAGNGPTLLLDAAGKLLSTSQRGGPGPVGFSEDGSPWHVLVESSRRFVVWDVAKNRALQTLEISFDQYELPEIDQLLPAMAATPVGNLVAASSILPDETGTIAVWDTATGELLRRFPIHAAALAFSPDGNLLAGGTEEGTIIIWSMDSGEEQTQLSWDTLGIHALAFTADKRRTVDGDDTNWLLAAGNAGGVITVWDVFRKIPRNYFRGSRHHVFDVEFSPDGTMLASCGRYSAKLWDTANGRELLDLPVANTMYDVAFSPNGQNLTIAATPAHGSLGGVFQFEIGSGRGIQSFRGLSGAVAKVWFSGDGQYLAALSHSWQVAVWNAATGELLHLLAVPNGLFTDSADLAFSPDGQGIAFSAADRATLWSLATGDRKRVWNLPPGLCDCLRFHGNDKLLLFRFETLGMQLPPTNQAHPDNHPRVCRLRDLLADDSLHAIAEITEFNAHVFLTNGAPDGSIFVVDGVHNDPMEQRRTVRAFNGLTGSEIWSLANPRKHDNSVLIVDPKGELLVIANEDGVDNLLELNSAEAIGDRVLSMSLSPGAEYVANGTRMDLYRGKNDEPFLRLASGMPAHCNQPQFSRDGKHLAWGRQDGTVFNCEIEVLLRQLKEIRLVD